MGDTISAADFKSNMDNLFAEISSVRDEITTIKGGQGRLTVTVHRLQSDKHKTESSGGDKNNQYIYHNSCLGSQPFNTC
jgi:hypothetical protein